MFQVIYSAIVETFDRGFSSAESCKILKGKILLQNPPKFCIEMEEL